MKKRTLLASLALTAILAACGKSEPAATAQAPEAAPAPVAVTKIVVGLDDNFPPMGFRDEKNELVGFDIDMAKEATKRLGMEVEFKPIDWSAKEAELNGKRIDVLWNGLTILESRKQHIAFTDPYMANRQIIIVKAGSDIADKTGLAGKVVGVQESSSAVDAMKKVLRKATCECQAIPVCCGTAYRNKGVQKFLKLTERHAAFTDLTPAILNEFISRIEVHERDQKRARYAIQHISIYFNYIGKFENEVTQLAEPTEQEIRQMREEIEEAKKEKSRAYHRQYSREYRARNLEKQREYDRMKAREYRARRKAQAAAAQPAQ